MKENKGITLIALVVTIIVLLILAGVAIAMLRGENGILGNASEAKYKNIIGSTDEQVKLAQMSLRTAITSNMVSKQGYIATEASNFKDLVDGVKKDLGVTAETNTASNEDFAVYQYLDYGTDSKDGTGYILITYTDNSLRSSLPKDIDTLNPLSINGVNFTVATAPKDVNNNNNAFSVNKAVLAYVIKVSNYSCELMKKAILTDTASVAMAAKSTIVSSDTELTTVDANQLPTYNTAKAASFAATAIGGAMEF